MSHVVLLPIVSLLFYKWVWQGGVFKVMKRSLFSVFSSLNPFPHVFGQVKECIRLEFHEMIKVPHIVSFPIDFTFLCDQGHGGGMLKPLKNDYF